MNTVTGRTKVPDDPKYYVAIVDRVSLSYSLNSYSTEWPDSGPSSRSLHLFGHMVRPVAVDGSPMSALLLAGRSIQDLRNDSRIRHVGNLNRRRGEFQYFANVPADFVPTLWAAYAGGHTQVLVGRGARLFRGASLLTYIGFQDRRTFEDWWGEAL